MLSLNHSILNLQELIVFKRRNKLDILRPPGMMSISLSEDNISCVRVTQGGIPKIENIFSSKYNNIAEATDILKTFVEKNRLKKSNCVYVLPFSDYRTLLIQKPSVPTSELRSALEWKIAELIDFAAQDAAIDYIQLPKNPNSDKPEMMYVVVAKKSIVLDNINLLNEAGLNPYSVDIQETSIRNIASKGASGERGLACLKLDSRQCHLILIHNKNIHLFRTIDLNLHPLFGKSLDQMQSTRLLDDLSLEIQRSIDYCSSNLKNPSISQLIICRSVDGNDEILKTIGESVGFPATNIDLNDHFESTIKLSHKMQNDCMIALGGALSKEVG